MSGTAARPARLTAVAAAAVIRAGSARPDTARPDTARPDTARPDTIRPDTIRADTVFMPFHWGGAGSANLVTNPALDPVSKMPEFKVCAVRLEAVR